MRGHCCGGIFCVALLVLHTVATMQRSRIQLLHTLVAHLIFLTPGVTAWAAKSIQKRTAERTAGRATTALYGIIDRRSAVVSTILSNMAIFPSYADDDFANIAARAQRISKQVDSSRPPMTSSTILATDKTAYDFSLPVSNKAVNLKDLVQQNFVELGGDDDDSMKVRDSKVKAIIVVNIKQDDPVARKDIPELMSLATRYNGAVAIVACPTDQGYYEPDTSQLLRLKLASEYGYGINPNTVVTDKINLLGSGAHPFWRWLQSTCRTPAGLGRLQGNFEKFLVDGRTGLPVRRYPRKYRPLNMANDIEALLVNKKLPPAGANYLEEWRTAATEAPTNTYRFEKGLNYFDQ